MILSFFSSICSLVSSVLPRLITTTVTFSQAIQTSLRSSSKKNISNIIVTFQTVRYRFLRVHMYKREQFFFLLYDYFSFSARFPCNAMLNNHTESVLRLKDFKKCPFPVICDALYNLQNHNMASHLFIKFFPTSFHFCVSYGSYLIGSFYFYPSLYNKYHKLLLIFKLHLNRGVGRDGHK